MILRDYQSALLEQARNLFRKNIKSVLLQAPTGAGKTALLTEMFKLSAARGKRCWMIVHRQELIEQTSRAFDLIGLKHGIVSGDETRDTHLPVLVCGIDTLRRRHTSYKQPDFMCFDECFVAGTIVDGKPIEQYCAGDSVTSFDEKTGYVLQSSVTHVFKNKCLGELYEITANGKVIVCTASHPFYVDGAWVQASNLKQGDYLYERMRRLRREKINRGKISLFALLQAAHVGAKQSRSARENEDAKSYELFKGKIKDEKNIEKNRAQTKNSRRQRKTYSRSSKVISQCVRLANRVCRAYWLLARRLWNAVSLQNRHSKSSEKNSNRSRWLLSLFNREAKARQEKADVFRKIRVESIKVYKQGRDKQFELLCPDGYVYNLEVEKYHTYFANDVLVHNCHHLGAQSWRKLYESYSDAFKIGLTATPWRLDGRGLSDFFQEMIIGPRVRDLIDQGWLCDYKVYAPVQPDLSGVKSSMGDFVNKDLFVKMNNAAITGSCVAEYKKHCMGKRGIVFAVNVEHSLNIMREFGKHGIECEHIDATTHKDLRYSAINRFKSGQTKILTNVGLFGEGFDLPDIECVMLMRPTKSLSLYLQMVGRALRPTKNKSHAIILDHSGNVLEHNLPCHEHEWSLHGRTRKKNTSKPVKVCPNCFAAQPSSIAECLECGYIFKKESKREGPDVADGELNELDKDAFKNQQAKKNQRRNFWQAAFKCQTREDFENVCLQYGYKKGYAFHVYKIVSGKRKNNTERNHDSILEDGS